MPKGKELSHRSLVVKKNGSNEQGEAMDSAVEEPVYWYYDPLCTRTRSRNKDVSETDADKERGLDRIGNCDSNDGPASDGLKRRKFMEKVESSLKTSEDSSGKADPDPRGAKCRKIKKQLESETDKERGLDRISSSGSNDGSASDGLKRRKLKEKGESSLKTSSGNADHDPRGAKRRKMKKKLESVDKKSALQKNDASESESSPFNDSKLKKSKAAVESLADRDKQMEGPAHSHTSVPSEKKSPARDGSKKRKLESKNVPDEDAEPVYWYFDPLCTRTRSSRGKESECKAPAKDCAASDVLSGRKPKGKVHAKRAQEVTSTKHFSKSKLNSILEEGSVETSQDVEDITRKKKQPSKKAKQTRTSPLLQVMLIEPASVNAKKESVSIQPTEPRSSEHRPKTKINPKKEAVAKKSSQPSSMPNDMEPNCKGGVTDMEPGCKGGVTDMEPSCEGGVTDMEPSCKGGVTEEVATTSKQTHNYKPKIKRRAFVAEGASLRSAVAAERESSYAGEHSGISAADSLLREGGLVMSGKTKSITPSLHLHPCDGEISSRDLLSGGSLTGDQTNTLLAKKAARKRSSRKDFVRVDSIAVDCTGGTLVLRDRGEDRIPALPGVLQEPSRASRVDQSISCASVQKTSCVDKNAEGSLHAQESVTVVPTRSLLCSEDSSNGLISSLDSVEEPSYISTLLGTRTRSTRSMGSMNDQAKDSIKITASPIRTRRQTSVQEIKDEDLNTEKLSIQVRNKGLFLEDKEAKKDKEKGKINLQTTSAGCDKTSQTFTLNVTASSEPDQAKTSMKNSSARQPYTPNVGLRNTCVSENAEYPCRRTRGQMNRSDQAASPKQANIILETAALPNDKTDADYDKMKINTDADYATSGKKSVMNKVISSSRQTQQSKTDSTAEEIHIHRQKIGTDTEAKPVRSEVMTSPSSGTRSSMMKSKVHATNNSEIVKFSCEQAPGKKQQSENESEAPSDKIKTASDLTNSKLTGLTNSKRTDLTNSKRTRSGIRQSERDIEHKDYKVPLLRGENLTKPEEKNEITKRESYSTTLEKGAPALRSPSWSKNDSLATSSTTPDATSHDKKGSKTITPLPKPSFWNENGSTLEDMAPSDGEMSKNIFSSHPSHLRKGVVTFSSSESSLTTSKPRCRRTGEQLLKAEISLGTSADTPCDGHKSSQAIPSKESLLTTSKSRFRRTRGQLLKEISPGTSADTICDGYKSSQASPSNESLLTTSMSRCRRTREQLLQMEISPGTFADTTCDGHNSSPARTSQGTVPTSKSRYRRTRQQILVSQNATFNFSDTVPEDNDENVVSSQEIVTVSPKCSLRKNRQQKQTFHNISESETVPSFPCKDSDMRKVSSAPEAVASSDYPCTRTRQRTHISQDVSNSPENETKSDIICKDSEVKEVSSPQNKRTKYPTYPCRRTRQQVQMSQEISVSSRSEDVPDLPFKDSTRREVTSSQEMVADSPHHPCTRTRHQPQMSQEISISSESQTQPDFLYKENLEKEVSHTGMTVVSPRYPCRGIRGQLQVSKVTTISSEKAPIPHKDETSREKVRGQEGFPEAPDYPCKRTRRQRRDSTLSCKNTSDILHTENTSIEVIVVHKMLSETPEYPCKRTRKQVKVPKDSTFSQGTTADIPYKDSTSREVNVPHTVLSETPEYPCKRTRCQEQILNTCSSQLGEHQTSEDTAEANKEFHSVAKGKKCLSRIENLSLENEDIDQEHHSRSSRNLSETEGRDAADVRYDVKEQKQSLQVTDSVGDYVAKRKGSGNLIKTKASGTDGGIFDIKDSEQKSQETDSTGKIPETKGDDDASNDSEQKCVPESVPKKGDTEDTVSHTDEDQVPGVRLPMTDQSGTSEDSMCMARPKTDEEQLMPPLGTSNVAEYQVPGERSSVMAQSGTSVDSLFMARPNIDKEQLMPPQGTSNAADDQVLGMRSPIKDHMGNSEVGLTNAEEEQLVPLLGTHNIAEDQLLGMRSPVEEHTGNSEVGLAKAEVNADEERLVASLSTRNVDGLLSHEIVKEEKKLHEETMKDVEKFNQEKQKVIRELDEDSWEFRYRRLQTILSKSNVYTSFLVKLMTENHTKNQRLKAERERRRVRQMAKAQRSAKGGEVNISSDETTCSTVYDEDSSSRDITSLSGSFLPPHAMSRNETHPILSTANRKERREIHEDGCKDTVDQNLQETSALRDIEASRTCEDRGNDNQTRKADMLVCSYGDSIEGDPQDPTAIPSRFQSCTVKGAQCLPPQTPAGVNGSEKYGDDDGIIANSLEMPTHHVPPIKEGGKYVLPQTQPELYFMDKHGGDHDNCDSVEILPQSVKTDDETAPEARAEVEQGKNSISSGLNEESRDCRDSPTTTKTMLDPSTSAVLGPLGSAPSVSVSGISNVLPESRTLKNLSSKIKLSPGDKPTSCKDNLPEVPAPHTTARFEASPPSTPTITHIPVNELSERSGKPKTTYYDLALGELESTPMSEEKQSEMSLIPKKAAQQTPEMISTKPRSDVNLYEDKASSIPRTETAQEKMKDKVGDVASKTSVTLKVASLSDLAQNILRIITVAENKSFIDEASGMINNTTLKDSASKTNTSTPTLEILYTASGIPKVKALSESSPSRAPSPFEGQPTFKRIMPIGPDHKDEYAQVSTSSQKQPSAVPKFGSDLNSSSGCASNNEAPKMLSNTSHQPVDETEAHGTDLQPMEMMVRKDEVEPKLSASRLEGFSIHHTMRQNSSSSEVPKVEGRKRMIDGQEVPEEQPLLISGGILRPYQLDGYMWLKLLYENGVNGILADEMGLGKTVQCVATIASLIHGGNRGPFLIVAPLSTLPNWMAEFQHFAPKVPAMLYHGSKMERMKMRKKFMRMVKVLRRLTVFPAVVTSYEIAMNDRSFLQHYTWSYLIVDEGHRIKNFRSRLIRELRQYDCEHRLLLTGTPLQNNLQELWTLLNFLLPLVFDDLGSFESWFDIACLESSADNAKIIAEEEKQHVLVMLHQILTPFMLRRIKSDVDMCIPPKKEILVYAPLTDAQQTYYTQIVKKTVQEEEKKPEEKVELNARGRPVRRASKEKINYAIMFDDHREGRRGRGRGRGKKKWEEIEEEENRDLENWVLAMEEVEAARNRGRCVRGEKNPVTLRLQNTMMLLRKCCNHPYLLNYPLDGAGELKIDQELVTSSGKLLLLDRMLPELQKGGHKVLMFSQMTSMLDILEDYCQMKEYAFCRLDGTMKIDHRKKQIEKFNGDKEVFLFLLSTRAGGLGINLAAADTVIIYDSDWNPQNDLQAQDRCHRIGQTRPVVIYRLVTANTIDQKIVQRAAAKRKLEKMIIHKGKFKSGLENMASNLQALHPKELLKLLSAEDHDDVVHGRDRRASHGRRDAHIISNRDLSILLNRQDLYDVWLEKMDASENKKESNDGVSPSLGEESGGLFEVIDVEAGQSGREFNLVKEHTGGVQLTSPRPTPEAVAAMREFCSPKQAAPQPCQDNREEQTQSTTNDTSRATAKDGEEKQEDPLSVQ